MPGALKTFGRIASTAITRIVLIASKLANPKQSERTEVGTAALEQFSSKGAWFNRALTPENELSDEQRGQLLPLPKNAPVKRTLRSHVRS